MTSNKEQWEREEYNEARRHEAEADSGGEESMPCMNCNGTGWITKMAAYEAECPSIATGGLANDMGFPATAHESFKCQCPDCQRYNEALSIIEEQARRLAAIEKAVNGE